MPHDDTQILLDAVRTAAKATRFVHAQRHAEGISGVAKSDASPVTVADWSSQAVVAMRLAQAPSLAGLPLVGEEDADTLRSPEQAPLLAEVVAAVSHAFEQAVEASAVLDAIDRGRGSPADRFLTLDPVDGTKGFLRRQQYAISLALLEGGRPTRGAVACPNLPSADGRGYDDADPEGTTAFATLGEGASIADTDGIRPIRVAEWRPGDPVRACESVESGHSRQDQSVELLAAAGAAGQPARLDSQCKYVVVARGGADIYMRLPVRRDYEERIWDHAAGALVAAEAGARVSDVTGASLDFGRGRTLSGNRGVFAGHPEVVARIVDAYASIVR